MCAHRRSNAEVAMRSQAPSIGSYIDGQPAEWRPTLKKLRAACRRELKGYAENMAYGMPSYLRGGQIEVAFGKQARYLSLYSLKQPVFDAHRGDLAGLSLGKGCIRYRRPEQVDWNVVARMLSDTRASTDEVC
jgi:uncharacterized protein YdhG (YjbR/CyaY superfamily)